MAKVIVARELGYLEHLDHPMLVVSLRFLKDGRMLAVRMKTYPLVTPIFDICEMLKDEYGADEVNYQPLLNLE